MRTAKIADISKLEVLEPLSVKEQIIKSATEAPCMLLRIDDVIASSKSAGGLQVGVECLRVEWANIEINLSCTNNESDYLSFLLSQLNCS